MNAVHRTQKPSFIDYSRNFNAVSKKLSKHHFARFAHNTMWILLPASAFPAVRAQATEKGANMQTYSVLTDEYAFTAAKTDAFITPSVFNSADKMPTEAENEDGNKAVKGIRAAEHTRTACAADAALRAWTC